MGNDDTQPPGALPRVLVIDDERDVGRAIARVLGASYDVLVLTRGADALEMVRGGARFAVILCDLRMPEMDGGEFHAALLHLAPDQAARVVFVTGAPEDRWVTRSAHVALGKPFDADALLALVRARAAT